MRKAFTLIELLVVISIIALLIAILLPALGAARTSAQIMQNSTHMRGIHQAFVVYGQDEDEAYPGLTKNGSAIDILPANIRGQATSPSGRDGGWPATRLGLIIQGDYISPDYAINPADPFPREAWTFGDNGLDSAGTRLDWRNFSYAFEEYADNGGGDGKKNAYKRQQYTINNLNAQTPVVGDRIVTVLNQDYDDPNAYIGVYSDRPGDFKMGLAWSDGHATIENTAEQDTQFGIYRNKNDNIYQRTNVEVDIETSPTPPNDQQVQSKFCYYNAIRHQTDRSEWPQ
jgi:prepilin-type N-terminal cleavage/methylation domain-containing protein